MPTHTTHAKKYVAKSETIFQKSLACPSSTALEIFYREIGDILPKISRATPNSHI